MNDESPVEGMSLDHLRQDIHDPIWPSAPLDPAVGPDMRHAHDGLRTVSGLIDFLHGLEEDLHGWIERESQEGVGHRPPRTKERPRIIDTYARGSRSWRGESIDVGAVASGGVRLVIARDDRTRVVVTNWGPGDLYVSHESGTVKAATNAVKIPAPGPDNTVTGISNSREFRTTGELWGFANAPGTSQKVDVQDEYGVVML